MCVCLMPALFFRGGICFFSGQTDARSVERGHLFFSCVCGLFFWACFFFGRTDARFPGWGPDGKLTIKFTCPKGYPYGNVQNLELSKSVPDFIKFRFPREGKNVDNICIVSPIHNHFVILGPFRAPRARLCSYPPPLGEGFFS